MEYVTIPSGRYVIGSTTQDGFPQDHEVGQVEVTVPSYWMMSTPVTNESFQQFVTETGYQTIAERQGWSFVFGYFLSETDRQNAKQSTANPLWYAVPGANWRHPEGRASDIVNRMDHPVVQVAREDAIAYCQWAGCRLPTEAEWEIAAKGGTNNVKYPWGDDTWQVDGRYQANIWQGKFPIENEALDGYVGTAPVRMYSPNGYGCYQMIGNVWEWCVNPARIPLALFQHTQGNDVWRSYLTTDDREFAIRGGSFLCHESYCRRYRIAARNASRGLEATNHLSFRCVKEGESI